MPKDKDVHERICVIPIKDFVVIMRRVFHLVAQENIVDLQEVHKEYSW